MGYKNDNDIEDVEFNVKLTFTLSNSNNDEILTNYKIISP